MFLYTVIEAIIAVIAGILIAICTKKADRVTYSKPDRIGQVTNVLLCLFYVGFSFFYLFLGIIANPRYNGFPGWIVSIIMASAALFVSFLYHGKGCLQSENRPWRLTKNA